jgi:hypothetical protein
MKLSKLQITVATAVAVVVIGAAVALWSVSGARRSSIPYSGAESGVGFSFFDLTAESELNDQLRERMRHRLGSDAIARRSPINLAADVPGGLDTNFPALSALNRRLNFSPRERIEHDITNLMYRYTQRKELPFRFVELVFSNRSKRPLLFRIHAGKEGRAVLDTLSEKYGPPTTLEAKELEARLLFWRQEQQALLVSVSPDRFGDPEYRIVIFFEGNLTDLIEWEEAERRQQFKEKEKAAKRFF